MFRKNKKKILSVQKKMKKLPRAYQQKKKKLPEAYHQKYHLKEAQHIKRPA
jgi:hypothetical protein